VQVQRRGFFNLPYARVWRDGTTLGAAYRPNGLNAGLNQKADTLAFQRYATFVTLRQTAANSGKSHSFQTFKPAKSALLQLQESS
jgi:hypothetical protein